MNTAMHIAKILALMTAIMFSILTLPAVASNAWLDTNGIRTDNVTLNGQAVTNTTYWLDPPFLSSKVSPNVLIVLDNSGSMHEQAYASDFDPTQFASNQYYGLFNPTKCYRYQSATDGWVIVGDVSATTFCGAFAATATAAHPVASGNLLNWATMRKVDVAKKLLIGGKANPRTVGTCCVKIEGENSSTGWWGWDFTKNHDNDTTPGLIYPFSGNIFRYAMAGDDLSLSTTNPTDDVTRQPTSDISVPAAWSIVGAASAWDATNDPVATPDTTTYIRSQAAGGTSPVIMGYADAYPVGIPPGSTITDVTIYVRAIRSSTSTMRIRGVLNVAGTNHSSPYWNLTSSWANYSSSWGTNPQSGAAWTWNDILPGTSANVLQGFGVRAETSPTAANYPRVTRVYIVIHANLPAGGPFRVLVDTGATSISGVIDQLSIDARFGLAFYNTNDEGGSISQYVDFNTTATPVISNITLSVNAMYPGTYTPLAETLYEMIRYFRQDTPNYPHTPNDYVVGMSNDPYYYKYSNIPGSGLADMYVPCAKSFILFLTDGLSTRDQNIPVTLQDYDGDSRDDGGTGDPTYGSSGSDYMDDIAYWGRINDIRSDITGTQNVILYPIFLFGTGGDLLMRAAINGGFDDVNGNNFPDCLDAATHHLKIGATQDELKECYRDSNGNSSIDPYNEDTNDTGDLPLTYFQGDDGYALQASIVEAISAILRRSASGTSVSVMGSSWKGEGSIFQAYFYPEKVEELRRVKWTGYFQSLFVDRFGLIHEDTNQDGILRSNDDKIVQITYTPGTGTQVQYFWDLTGGPEGEPDGQVDSATPVGTVSIADAKPIWNAGRQLALRPETDRRIYTTVTGTSLIDFNYNGSSGTDNSTVLRPYLRAKTATSAADIIKFVRGGTVAGWRDRKITVAGSMVESPTECPADLCTWKLGDIVFSDPYVVAGPKEGFDRIYGDHSYYLFRKRWSTRRTMIYVGGNDGMLHAFDGGYSESAATDAPMTAGLAQIKMNSHATLDSDYLITGYSDLPKTLGKEVWAFVPYDALPHLAWVTDPDYLHVNYVDLIPRVTDAQIFPDDGPNGTHPGGWGTVMIIGMRFGGAEIDVEDDFGSGAEKRAFKSAYYAFDITNPDVAPTLLWRSTHDELGFTLGVPAIVRVENQWLAVVGSGPSNFRGSRPVDNTITNTKFTQDGVVAGLTGMKSNRAFLFIVDLLTGKPNNSWTVHSTISGMGWTDKGLIRVSNLATMGFTSSPSIVDYPLDFNYDLIIAGTSYCEGTCTSEGWPTANGEWSGHLYRFDLRTAGTGTTSSHIADPGQWRWSRMLTVDKPISTKPSAALDPTANMWVYFGTGRFLHVDDRLVSQQQMFYGFKESCYATGCSTMLDTSDFLESGDAITIQTNGTLQTALNLYNPVDPPNPVNVTNFDALATYMQNYGTGWRITIPDTRERVTTNGFVVAGIAGFGTYTPSDDVCDFQGVSKQWFPYYLTGTTRYSPQGSGDVIPLHVTSGSGLPSAPAVHVDARGKATLFIQGQTGAITSLALPGDSMRGRLGGGSRECTQ